MILLEFLNPSSYLLLSLSCALRTRVVDSCKTSLDLLNLLLNILLVLGEFVKLLVESRLSLVPKEAQPSANFLLSTSFKSFSDLLLTLFLSERLATLTFSRSLTFTSSSSSSESFDRRQLFFFALLPLCVFDSPLVEFLAYSRLVEFPLGFRDFG